MIALAVTGGVLVSGGVYLATKSSGSKPTAHKSESANTKKPKGKPKDKGPRIVSFAGRAFDVTYSVRALPKDQESAKNLPNLVRNTIGKVEQLIDKGNAESALNRVNRAKAGERVELPAEFVEILSSVATVHGISGGAVDVTFGKLDELSASGKKPTDAEVREAKKKSGFSLLGFDAKDHSIKKSADDVELDLASIAPAYAVDQVAAILEKAGVENYQINLSSLTRAKGEQAPKRPWSVVVSLPESARGGVFGRVASSEPIAMGSFVERVATSEQPAASAASKTEKPNDPKVTAMGIASRPRSTPDSLIDPRTGAPTDSKSVSPRAFASTALESRLVALAARRMSPEAAITMANKNQWGLVLFSVADDGASTATMSEVLEKKLTKAQPLPTSGAAGLPPSSAGKMAPGTASPRASAPSAAASAPVAPEKK